MRLGDLSYARGISATSRSDSDSDPGARGGAGGARSADKKVKRKTKYWDAERGTSRDCVLTVLPMAMRVRYRDAQ